MKTTKEIVNKARSLTANLLLDEKYSTTEVIALTETINIIVQSVHSLSLLKEETKKRVEANKNIIIGS